MEVVLISVVVVGISFLALGFNIFFRKDGKFPANEVGKNKDMKNLGIFCAKCEEHKKWREIQRKRRAQINPGMLKIDTTAF